MTTIRRCAVLLSLFAMMIPVSLFSQSTRRRAVTIPASDEITILQTTDLHHHANGSAHVGLDVDPVDATSVVGAYSRIASYVGYERSALNHPVLLVDSGDWTMGTFYDLTLGSQPLAMYFLSTMRYDAVTLGNHEFDYTPQGLAQIIGLGQSTVGFHVPIVASNMNLNGDTDLAPLVGTGKAIQPSYVETLSNGLKIGYIGLMGEAAALDSISSPVTFTPLSTSYASIQSMVDDLRNTGGAQIVIALSHSGTDATGTSGEDIDLAKHVHGINVVASGHTHTPLASSHAVANGTWTTQVIDAGAFGTNVARLDLLVDRTTGATTLEYFNNVPMTAAGLAAVHTGLSADPTTTAVVNGTDHQINASLGPLFTKFFPDYSVSDLGKGIYHPVAVASQNMVSNATNPVLSPNGLGNLAADSIRNVPNGIIAQTLAAAGGNPANVPGFDFTTVQAGIVATGVLRGGLQTGVPISFADIYNVLPLGISPDTTQTLPVGYPLISAYVDPADFRKIAALQLVAQSNLVPSDYYLNISGVSYGLKTAETYTYFKYATAAAVIQVTSGKLAAGSAPALQAFSAVATLGLDQGAALLAAAGAGNPYAVAMVDLNDVNPDSAHVAANLTAVGQVAAAAIGGTKAVSALVVSKAVDAIGPLSGFAATDGENTGTPTMLSDTTRIRVVTDLYAVLLLGAVNAQFGVAITPYQAATGMTVLSSADFPTLLGNRIDADPATPGVQELKEWEALLSNVGPISANGTGLGGSVNSDYGCSQLFTSFPSCGNAVTIRNSNYPLPAIGQLVSTVSTLSQQP